MLFLEINNAPYADEEDGPIFTPIDQATKERSFINRLKMCLLENVDVTRVIAK